MHWKEEFGIRGSSEDNVCNYHRQNFSALHSALYPLTPNYYKERKALKILHNYTNSVIDKRKASHIMDNEVNETDSFGIKKRQAFLDLLLTYKIDGQSLSRNDIREEVDTFMFEVR